MRHAAVQGARGRAARRLRERDKRERVRGRSAENHLPMGLGRADSLRGREAVGDNAQPMGGWAKRGDFKSAQISRGCFAGLLSSELSRRMSTIGHLLTLTNDCFEADSSPKTLSRQLKSV